MSVSTEAGTLNGTCAPSRRSRSAPAIGTGMSLLLGMILAYSALLHLANPYFFLTSVYDYKLTGVWIGEVVAALLPHIELAVGLCLIVGCWRRQALLIAAVLFVMFVSVQLIAWSWGLQISCGCFGPSGSEPIGFRTIFSSLGMFVVACLGYYLVK